MTRGVLARADCLLNVAAVIVIGLIPLSGSIIPLQMVDGFLSLLVHLNARL
jgi:hypothetical protein